jgi:hypothetical protein
MPARAAAENGQEASTTGWWSIALVLATAASITFRDSARNKAIVLHVSNADRL